MLRTDKEYIKVMKEFDKVLIKNNVNEEEAIAMLRLMEFRINLRVLKRLGVLRRDIS